MPKNPLLVVSPLEAFVKGVVKINKKVKKKPVKKTAKKKIKKPDLPGRPSPFKIGDEVWYGAGWEFKKGVIHKHTPPRKSYGELVWSYGFKDQDNATFAEENLYPAKIFTLIATDATKMKRAPFQDEMNKLFGADSIVLQVFRDKQKRPWAYYVIPDKNLIFEEKKHTHYPYGPANGYKTEDTSTLQKVPADKVELRLMPISSAPQEILTYLGVHVYGRKWVRLSDSEL